MGRGVLQGGLGGDCGTEEEVRGEGVDLVWEPRGEGKCSRTHLGNLIAFWKREFAPLPREPIC